MRIDEAGFDASWDLASEAYLPLNPAQYFSLAAAEAGCADLHNLHLIRHHQHQDQDDDDAYHHHQHEDGYHLKDSIWISVSSESRVQLNSLSGYKRSPTLRSSSLSSSLTYSLSLTSPSLTSLSSSLTPTLTPSVSSYVNSLHNPSPQTWSFAWCDCHDCQNNILVILSSSLMSTKP